jgi:3-deoxy-D-manno-octulosonic-acid transferase
MSGSACSPATTPRADLAVVGGQLRALRRSQPLEPAACGAPVIVGPHHATQQEGVAALVAAGGGRVARTDEELLDTLTMWLGDEASRATAGAAALATVRARRGATGRTIAALVERGVWPPA